ncbi:hypothetical protein PUN28_017687 [Cardiocondyla obscurior]|uniref:Uncharacterized protein n=1 Tax=Cardiocondyla obscurior TaxID=286306 RepID=A0AAW2ELB7_9HYME
MRTPSSHELPCVGAHAVYVERRGCRSPGWPDPGANARATLRESRSPLGREPSRRTYRAVRVVSLRSEGSTSVLPSTPKTVSRGPSLFTS